MIKFVLATPANAVHICPPCNQNTPYTSQAIAFKDIHAFLPPACVFANGKDKHLVITCQHLTSFQTQSNTPKASQVMKASASPLKPSQNNFNLRRKYHECSYQHWHNRQS
ncbi:hypothetical protein [Moraxella sp. ZY200743]|uniref:hypothetical protein n=1 Tax=Moraxella sp. ZY200743 TaxID=2911970 RepID=UPI003D7D27C3